MAYLIKNRIIFSCSNLIENNNEVLDNPQKCLILDFQCHFTLLFSLKYFFSLFLITLILEPLYLIMLAQN